MAARAEARGPHLLPQSSLAQWGASAAMQVVSRRRSEVRVPWLHSLAATQDEDQEDQTDTEGEDSREEEEEEEEEAEEKLSEVRAEPSGVREPPGPTAHRGVRSRGPGTWHAGQPAGPFMPFGRLTPQRPGDRGRQRLVHTCREGK